MKYRQVGNTGVEVSEIGFGCGGNAGLMVAAPPEEQLATIERAVELGINYFDNSPDYGDGVSETNLGRAIRTLGIHPYLNTKVEIRAHNLDDVAGHIERSVDESLARLGVDHIDFVQIHNAPRYQDPGIQGRVYSHIQFDHYLRPGGALEGLERVQRAGKARFIGFITRGGDFDPASKLIDTGRFNLINVQAHLLNPTPALPKPEGLHVDLDWENIITYAHAHGVGVSIYSPLAGGVLTDSSIAGRPGHPLSRDRRPADGSLSVPAQRAKALGFLSQPGRNLSQAAIRFLLMFEGISITLGGFSSKEQVEENCTNSGAPGLSAEEMKRVEMVWRGNFGLPRE